jgi:hypothetical protein
MPAGIQKNPMSRLIEESESDRIAFLAKRLYIDEGRRTKSLVRIVRDGGPVNDQDSLFLKNSDERAHNTW